MTDTDRDRMLAECLEDYHRRRARGEAPAPGDYAPGLRDHFAEFVELLAAESAIDEAMAPQGPTEFPVAFGEYTLLREIGRGAVGVVYEAIQRPLGRKVAIKVLRTGFDTDERTLQRFASEARTCAQLRHDNVVPLYGWGEVEGRPYYAMALLPGKPLSALIKSGEAPTGRALYEGLAGIADALDTMHRAGIIHRDVKPSNIVVEPGGRMILTDFGLARTALSVTLTGTGEALGTPLYMSPEQMLGRRDEIDGRSDVYGLGASLYEAVAGRPPFRSDDLRELMRMILHQQPRSLAEVAPAAGREVARVAMKAIGKRREDRYATAAALRDDLLRLARGERPEGKPVSALTNWVRENRRVWVPAAAAVLVGLGAFLWWSDRPGRIAIAGTHPPGAVVEVNGRAVARLPYEASLPAGTYRITVRRDHFLPWEKTVELRPLRDFDPGTVSLVPADAEGVEVLRRTAWDTLALATGERPETTRSAGDGEGVTLGWPRGPVRLVDLTTFRLHVGEEVEADRFVLEFKRGDEVLHREDAFTPRQSDEVLPLPADVVDRLRIGDRVTWGMAYTEGRKTRRSTATFDVVGDPPGLAADLAKADQILRHDPDHVPEIRAFLFLKHGLLTAAWQETQPSFNREGPAPTVGLAAALVEAVRRAGLGEGAFGYDARMRLNDFGTAARDAFYASHPTTAPR